MPKKPDDDDQTDIGGSIEGFGRADRDAEDPLTEKDFEQINNFTNLFTQALQNFGTALILMLET